MLPRSFTPLVIAGLLSWTLMSPASARPTIGAELGLSLAEFSFESPENLPLPKGNYGANANLRAALRARFQLSPRVAAVCGMSYETNGIDIEFLSRRLDGTTRDAVETTVLDYLVFPLLVEATLPGDFSSSLFVRLGAEFGLLVDADTFVTIDGDLQGDKADTEDVYPRTEWTLTAGGGVRLFQRLDAYATYRHGLRNMNEGLNREEHKYRNRAVTLSLTYWFSDTP